MGPGPLQERWKTYTSLLCKYYCLLRPTWTEKVTPESLHPLISAVQALPNEENVWIAILTDKEEELHHIDFMSQAFGHQLRLVDLVKAQNENSHIALVH